MSDPMSRPRPPNPSEPESSRNGARGLLIYFAFCAVVLAVLLWAAFTDMRDDRRLDRECAARYDSELVEYGVLTGDFYNDCRSWVKRDSE